jgi:hypothetical protein
MPEIRGAGHTNAITKLRDAGGFDAAVKLGEQALAALTGGNVGGKTRSDAEEILQAVSLLAAHLDGVTTPGVLNPNNPASILTHLARGDAMDAPLTDAQAKGLTDHLEKSIKGGENLAQIAEAAKNMDYGNPARESPSGLAHVGGNFGSSLKEMIKDLFEEHQPQAAKDLGVDQMHGGLQAM